MLFANRVFNNSAVLAATSQCVLFGIGESPECRVIGCVLVIEVNGDA